MLLLAALACGATPAPLPAEATPMVITVVAPPDAEVVLDTTWGSLAWLRLAHESEELSSVAVDYPGRFCVCRCGADQTCPECAAPEHTAITLAPGERRDFPWNGKVLTWREDTDGDWCAQSSPLPPGSWRLAACDEPGARCAKSDQPLPTDAPIVLELSGPEPPAHTCPTAMERRLGAAHLERLRSLGTLDRRLRKCDAQQTTCVEPAALDQALTGARSQRCSLWVIPRGAEIEVLAFAPLPSTSAGGERFSAFVDPWGTLLTRVKYEQ